MGQKVTFDPVNKIIQVDIAPVGGEISLDVKVDLYSDGKEDWVASSELFKYRFPIRAVGGDPLPGSKALGSTFFLDPAWKIRPYEGNHRFLVNGNLYSEDGTSPFTNTVGTWQIAIESSVSSLVDSTVQQLSEIEHSSFNNCVTVDVVNGQAGISYPLGNTANPVNNVTDAEIIAVQRGFRTLCIIGDITLGSGEDVSGYTLLGQNATRSNITFNSAAATEGCEVIEAYVAGNLDGGTILRNCVIGSLNYINGFVYECMIETGTISLGGSNAAHFLNCYSGTPGTGTPILDMNGVGAETTPCALRNYSGGIELRDLTGGASVSVDFVSGQLKIHPSCTNGVVVARGDSKVIDAITEEQMVSGTYNGNLVLINETSCGLAQGGFTQTDRDTLDAIPTADELLDTLL